MLDLIKVALEERGIKFCRIDGRSSMSQRKDALEVFGRDPEYSVMLASIGAAGEGYVVFNTHCIRNMYLANT